MKKKAKITTKFTPVIRKHRHALRVITAAVICGLVATLSLRTLDIWQYIQYERSIQGAVQNAPHPKNKPMPRYQIMRRKNKVLVTEQKPDAPLTTTTPGTTPVFYSVNTNGKPVIFVTIDDGVFKEQSAAEYMESLQLPVTLFLTVNNIHTDYDFFKRLDVNGSTIENHTVTHPHMKKQTLDQQRAEICQTSDDLAIHYGRRPILFRPPYGEYNDHTLQAARDCGIKAVVMWNVTVDKGQLAFQEPRHELKPGDIVLLHFRQELRQDIQVILDQASKQNMYVGNLEDWL